MPSLLENAAILSAIVQHVADAVIVMKVDGTVREANASALQLFGYEGDELVGTPLKNLIQMPISLTPKASFKAKKISGLHKQGHKVEVVADVSPVKVEGEVLLVCVLRPAVADIQDEEDLYNKAMYDTLTGLANRNNFRMHLNEAVTLCKRYKDRNFCIFYCDLNKFKQVNDSMGHQAGDELLKQSAARLKTAVRDSDLIARVGGDEFLLLAQQVTAGDCVVIAQRMVDALDEPFDILGKKVRIGISIGISIFPDDAANGVEMLHHADVAMYMSKRENHSAYLFFSKELLKEAKN
jgi:diguanylate cyclase (GGDEF)-like protein/PAS domain S-box-containing protein